MEERMSGNSSTPEQSAPKPAPELERFEALIGKWRITGRTLGADSDDVFGTACFTWLHDGAEKSFFVVQDMLLDYAGTEIRSHEVIGYDAGTRRFASFVYSNMASDPWPYTWTLDGDKLTIAIKHGAMDATFTAAFAEDRNSFSGGWRPNPGADEEINAPYDLVATRIA
jgi:hypothetical protein